LEHSENSLKSFQLINELIKRAPQPFAVVLALSTREVPVAKRAIGDLLCGTEFDAD
jgi:hypothetical protein